MTLQTLTALLRPDPLPTPAVLGDGRNARYAEIYARRETLYAALLETHDAAYLPGALEAVRAVERDARAIAAQS